MFGVSWLQPLYLMYPAMCCVFFVLPASAAVLLVRWTKRRR